MVSSLTRCICVFVWMCAARMKASLEIKDRRYRLKTYKNCFLGTEAVAWLQAEGVVGVRCGLDRRRCRSQCSDRLPPSLFQSEVDALRIGNLLMDAGVFEHVTKGHEFKVTRPAVAVAAFSPSHCAILLTQNEPLFYRFIDHGHAAKVRPGWSTVHTPQRSGLRTQRC